MLRLLVSAKRTIQIGVTQAFLSERRIGSETVEQIIVIAIVGAMAVTIAGMLSNSIGTQAGVVANAVNTVFANS